jgi:hypothetical protein
MSTTWVYEFGKLILASALRGDLLTQVPLDPKLFGSPGDRAPVSVSPNQYIASLIVRPRFRTTPRSSRTGSVAR